MIKQENITQKTITVHGQEIVMYSINGGTYWDSDLDRLRANRLKVDRIIREGTYLEIDDADLDDVDPNNFTVKPKKKNAKRKKK